VEERLLQRAVKLAFYRAALRSGASKLVWGALTGIRPAGLVCRLLDEGLSERAAMRRFIRDYDVSPERAAMCLQTALESRRVRQSLVKRDICLYIGIPYCPTRCAYCSFVSADVSRSMESIPSFLAALGHEMEAAAAVVRACGLRVVSVYMGGGTPTTLREEQLEGCYRGSGSCLTCAKCGSTAWRPDGRTPSPRERWPYCAGTGSPVSA
jgi:oxygen-independent coproporphyrinogen-3 oxidase